MNKVTLENLNLKMQKIHRIKQIICLFLCRLENILYSIYVFLEYMHICGIYFGIYVFVEDNKTILPFLKDFQVWSGQMVSGR